MKRLCIILLFYAYQQGCKGYQEVGADGYRSPSSALASADGLPDLSCESGMSLQPKPSTRVTWEVTKINTVTKAESPFIGSNLVFGQLNIPNRDLTRARAVLNFDIGSTNSGDALRDERIHEYIFGRHKGYSLRFTLTGFKEDDLTLNDNSSTDAVALGKFEVAGKTIDVEVPVLIKARAKSVVLTSSKLLKINMRSLTPEVNGVDIADSIKQILQYVNNVEVKDEVVLDFNIEFVDNCIPRD